MTIFAYILGALFLIFALFVFFGMWLDDRHMVNEKESNAPYISYKLFSTSCAINPRRWRMQEDAYEPLLSYYDDVGDRHYVKLHLLPYWRIQLQETSKANRADAAERQDSYKKMLEVIQRDVQVAIDKSNQEINRGMKETADIIKKGGFYLMSEHCGQI